jgi:hypothetical protein
MSYSIRTSFRTENLLSEWLPARAHFLFFSFTFHALNGSLCLHSCLAVRETDADIPHSMFRLLSLQPVTNLEGDWFPVSCHCCGSSLGQVSSHCPSPKSSDLAQVRSYLRLNKYAVQPSPTPKYVSRRDLTVPAFA